VNLLILAGRLADNPVHMLEGPAGQPVTFLDLEVNIRRPGGGLHTDMHELRAWGPLAERTRQLHVGCLVRALCTLTAEPTSPALETHAHHIELLAPPRTSHPQPHIG
jgi:hypothetical protein